MMGGNLKEDFALEESIAWAFFFHDFELSIFDYAQDFAQNPNKSSSDFHFRLAWIGEGGSDFLLRN